MFVFFNEPEVKSGTGWDMQIEISIFGQEKEKRLKKKMTLFLVWKWKENILGKDCFKSYIEQNVLVLLSDFYL